MAPQALARTSPRPIPRRCPRVLQKEQLFLEALSAYYYEGKALISDEEFSNLKDDLVWNGSKVGRAGAPSHCEVRHPPFIALELHLLLRPTMRRIKQAFHPSATGGGAEQR